MGAILNLTGPNPQIEVDFNPTFDVAFGDEFVTVRGIAQIREAVGNLIKAMAKLPTGSSG